MFERYTEKARRVIFFGLYEARQYGSPVIETEHILLGILRETKSVTVGLPPGAVESIRAQIDARAAIRKKISTSVDLPVSNAVKRVLAYGAEEAERLNHRHIDSEHLFLGLLREKDCLATELLKPFALTLEQIRKKIGENTPIEDFNERILPSSYQGRLRRTTNVIKLRGGLWDADYIREVVKQLCEQNWHWRKASWKSRDISVHRKSGKISLDVSLAQDAESFELVKGGRKKDYCVICRWELFESDEDADHGTGYTNGREWICTECYDRFWDRPDFVSGSYSEIT
jgi:hypothetical protein